MSARDVATTAAVVVGVVNGAVGIYGAWRWYRVEEAPGFWPALRIAQLVATAYALLVAGLWLGHDRARQDLFYLYALLPLAINVIGEQLRIAAAETVLAGRGLAGADQVGSLPADQQRSVVLAIVRRELGVMAGAALVVCFLALRAAGTF